MRRSDRRGIICLHRRMIDAQHREAVERHVADELVVARDHRLDVPQWSRCSGSMLVTTAITAGSRRKRAVAFVGLHHHPVAGAEPRVGAVGVDDAAVDHGGIEMRRPPAPRRPGWWWWSCRACRRSRSTISAASARPASRRAAPPGSAARARSPLPDCPVFTADDTTTTCALPRLAASWPMATGMPASRRRRTLAESAMSLPCTA